MFQITWDEIAPFLHSECRVSRKRGDVICRFNQIAKYFKDKEFNRVNVVLLFDKLQAEGKRHSTINNLLAFVKHCSAYLVWCGKAQTDFMLNYRYFEKQPVMLDVLSDEEVDQIINIKLPRSRDAEYINEKYSLITEILSIYTFRISELANIEWDKGFNGSEFIIYEGKTFSASRKLEVLPYLIPRINRLRRYEHNFVFGGPKGKLLDATFNAELRLRCQACGINKKIAAHSLRRSSITSYIDKETDCLKLLKITGHKDANSLNRYNHLSYKKCTKILETSHMATKHWSIDRIKQKYKDHMQATKIAPCDHYLLQGRNFVLTLAAESTNCLPEYLADALNRAKNDSCIELMDESIHHTHDL